LPKEGAATPTPDPALADDVDRLAHQRGAEGAWAQAANLFRDASRLTPDPPLRDDRLTRSVDALVAAGDCMGAAALVPAVESLRETPLRNAVLAYLAIVRGRAAEAEVRLRRVQQGNCQPNNWPRRTGVARSLRTWGSVPRKNRTISADASGPVGSV